MEDDFKKLLSLVSSSLRDTCTKVITEIHHLRGKNPSNLETVSSRIVNIIHHHFNVYSANLYNSSLD
jgi:hypothetical protein